MMPHNLFSLITDRLMLHSGSITMATYNVLLEVQCELICCIYLPFLLAAKLCFLEVLALTSHMLGLIEPPIL